MNIIEIVSADAMAEKTEKRRIIIENEKERQREIDRIELEKAFYKLIEKVKQEIHKASQSGFNCCEVVVRSGEYWGINYKKDMKKIIEIFSIAGYDINWHEYSTSWTYRSGKRSYFWIKW